MSSLINFLSGHTVYRMVDRMFEKLWEPHYRGKACKNGFGEAFEQELDWLHSIGASHASVRAYYNAKNRFGEKP